MRIVMIGPVYPYKTGLSYYVSLLYQQLQKHHEVKLFSYSMQYPRFLYKKEQKDYTDDVLRLDDVEYILNTANPISCLSTAKRINEEKPDLVIFQWLHPYFAPCYEIIARHLKQGRILFMCHNVLPHERFPFDRLITRMALRYGDFFTVHAKSDGKDLEELLPNAKYQVTVHPSYSFFNQRNLKKQEAREELGLVEGQNVLLFFGLVREYKGLKHLINALGELKSRNSMVLHDLVLLIAGDFAGKRAEYDELIKSNQVEEYIQITDQHLPTGEVEKYFVACDLVVLPYESATQSGVVQVAYSFNRPVVATEVGGLPDVVFDGKTGYLVKPQNPVEIAEAIADFFENNRAIEFENGIETEKYKYSWEKMEEVILSFSYK